MFGLILLVIFTFGLIYQGVLTYKAERDKDYPRATYEMLWFLFFALNLHWLTAQ